MFDSAADFANVPIFGGLPLEFINAMALLVMVIALSSMLTYAPTLFAKVMNIDEAFSYGQTAKNAVQGVVAEVSDTISGQKMMDNVANLKDFAKKLTPGRVFMEAAQEKARKAAMFAMRQALKIAGTAADIPPEVVDAAMDAYEKAENAKREAKKKKEEKERKEREARQQQRDSDFGVHDK